MMHTNCFVPCLLVVTLIVNMSLLHRNQMLNKYVLKLEVYLGRKCKVNVKQMLYLHHMQFFQEQMLEFTFNLQLVQI